MAVTPPVDRMKIGIVGGHGHESIRIHPEAEFAWAGDGFDGEAERRAMARGGRFFPDMAALLRDFDPALIYIGSAYARNGALAVEALRAGRSVIIEKPLAATHDDLATLRRITTETGLSIIAEFTMRWSPAIRKVRDLVQSGALGKPVLIQAQKTYKFGRTRPAFYRHRSTFGGIIPWVAAHAIDYCSWCTGLRYRSVSATHGNRRFPDYPEMEDHAALFFQMDDHVPCLITADFLRPEGAASHGDDRLRITGENAVVEMQDSEVVLIDASHTRRWKCEPSEENQIQRACDLVGAALGKSADLSMNESFAITEAALIARDAADAHARTHRLTELTIGQL